MSNYTNLLFGVQALKLGLIDATQLTEACAAAMEHGDSPLAEILVAEGTITPEQGAKISQLIEEELARRDGDALKALGELTDLRARDALRATDHIDVTRTLTILLPAEGQVRLSAESRPERRERYQRMRLVGEGSHGYVWAVFDNELNREVALKELKPEPAKDPNIVQRFFLEAQITGQLAHPNIVPVYDFGRRPEDRQPFYTMPLQREHSLHEVVARFYQHRGEGADDALRFRNLLATFVSVCNAVAYANSRGVIHRDLKPGNVVLGEFGEVVLVDWGLAKIVDDGGGTEVTVSVTAETADESGRTWGVTGSPGYMAPEQAEGRNDLIDSRTDVYGLGATLFECLTGQPPHDGASATDILKRIVTGVTPRARDLDPGVPRALDAICARAMAKKRSQRYESASALADDVRRWLADEPLSISGEPLGQRLLRRARRNRVVVTLLAIASTTLISLWATTWQAGNQAIRQQVEMLARETEVGRGRLLALLDVLRQHAQYLAGQQAVKELLQARQQGGQTEGDSSGVEKFFEEFLVYHPDYTQVRLLNEKGMEIVRLERVSGPAGGEAEVRLSTELSDKSGRDYFKETMAASQVFLSRIELNREDRRVADGDVPVARAAVPVSLDGPFGTTRGGVVVINVDFRLFFGGLEPASVTSGEHALYVTDSRGYYLHLSPKDPSVVTFGIDHEVPELHPDSPPNLDQITADLTAPKRRKYLIQQRYPELEPFYDGSSTDRETTSFMSGAGGEGPAIALTKLRYDVRRSDRLLVLAVAAPYEEIERRARDAGSSLFFNLTICFVIAIYGAGLLAWYRSARRKSRAGAPSRSTPGSSPGQA